MNEPNVEIHDHDGDSLAYHNSGRYDVMHYDFAGAREVVDALASGSMKSPRCRGTTRCCS